MLKKFTKIVFVLSIVFGIAIFIYLYDLYQDIKDDIDKIVNYNPKLSSQFYDKNGKLLANTFKDENREYVNYDDIPARVIEGLVAIEDTQFFEHFGINPDAISRAMIKNIKSGGYSEGASTITQQLVKILVLTREKKIMRKVKEALLSVRLESLLTKEEILERYLNQVYFGHGYYGIKTAAKGYFNKNLYELSLKEIAILVGLPRAPSFYDPTRNLQVSLTRANQVISRMHTLGWINEEQYNEALSESPQIFNQTLTQNIAPWAIDYAVYELSKDFPDILYGGYKVYLTIDLDAQNIAQTALKNSYNLAVSRNQAYIKELEEKDWIKNPPEGENIHYIEDEVLQKELNGSLLSMENHTGKILAIIGGVDYNKSVFHRAFQSKRQVGSAIKPFFYQTALNEGYNPATLLFDISRTYTYKVDGVEKRWSPRNYGENFRGVVSLRDSLVSSRNLSTLNLVTDVGVGKVTNDLIRYGFKDIVNDLSITLGSMAVNLVEFSSAFSIFSNLGTQVKPYIVEKVVDRNNQSTNYEPSYLEQNPKEQAYLISSILQDAVKSGTGRRSRVAGIELAGKTGTTNDNMDAWFCGYSPSIQTLVWFGNDNNTPMRKTETGSTLASPAFAYFYKNYLELNPQIEREFSKPEGVFTANFKDRLEFYTKTSPLPDADTQIILDNSNQNELEF
ncbi:penicillin-binding protein 1A [Arcobacter porcinus]|uniref:Penicillin-binding protein 1A n=1 Tax=Arcobacter porcinus TaxID=1935204 RepID=A0ABX2YEF0_9BACT|nr:PBP1A family penicillin-binding protein [Arcobacter porcinus]OCL83581.1 Penicillin-binding protein 1A [Arcobacter porcinus]OCL83800.1 Penicillin-binding protein 1A [Arcobacter porcinus]OCL92793.1 Penicillin-binding protein 1A [Arcobacter porcinus]